VDEAHAAAREQPDDVVLPRDRRPDEGIDRRFTSRARLSPGCHERFGAQQRRGAAATISSPGAPVALCVRAEPSPKRTAHIAQHRARPLARELIARGALGPTVLEVAATANLPAAREVGGPAVLETVLEVAPGRRGPEAGDVGRPALRGAIAEVAPRARGLAV